tara:strand:- start:318 stop:806 length:489 start_codon:yes stop_codon:yes gene_type:complete
MDNQDKVNLQKILQQNDIEETTDIIRTVKHSGEIKENITRMEELKKKYARLRKSNPKEFEQMCLKQCNFLFTHYTNIYNKLYKDELNLTIMAQFITVLKEIEDENIDQHEGSYKIGELLKKIYIDSALRQGEKIDNKAKKGKKPSKLPVKNISWKEFKMMNA